MSALRRWLCLAACTGSLFKSKAAPPTIYVLVGRARYPPTRVPAAAIPADLAVLKPS